MNRTDTTILRELAARVAEVASLPIQEERRRLWRRHNALKPDRPMVLIFPEGSWRELLPEAVLRCEDSDARRIEADFRRRIYYHEHFADDMVIEADFKVPAAVSLGSWGLEPRRHPSTEAHGAWAFEPVLNDRADLDKLQTPEVTHDQEETKRRIARAEELFGDILTIRPVGVQHISYHLMSRYTDLRGLEQMMVDMFEEPEMIHNTMTFFVEAYESILRRYEELNLLSLNNDGTYHSSGAVGYTEEIPKPGYDPEHIRPSDMWSSAESQELAGVGPSQHDEFALTYERQLLAPFALNGYGCCEPLTDRLDLIFSIPNIRRISISPWADVDVAAERLGPNYIYNWKPKPMDLVGGFDEDAIRGYLRHTLEVARQNDCVLEMVLKDTHTCEHHPERFDRWSQIAREEIDRVTSAG